MKVKSIIPLLCILFLGTTTTHAQFLKKLGKRAEKAAENAVLRKTDQKVTKETEKTLDTLLNSKKGKKPNNSKESKTAEHEENSHIEEREDMKDQIPPQESPKLWSKYNFVPGDEIIFYDDLTGEENGEFPSRWDILKGNAENASFDGENVIQFGKTGIIMPLMETDDYMPEVFTLEFDIYFDVKKDSWRTNFYLDLGQGDHGYHYFGEGNKDWAIPIKLKKDGVSFTMDVKGVRKNFDDTKTELKELGQGAWRHVAVAFNKRSLKLFIDEYRVLNIPNLGFKPELFTIGYINTSTGDDEIRAIKNIRLAEGGKKLYDRVVAEGKFVTRGILFDVNSATIMPKSGGVLNEVAAMMQDHQNLDFRIEGHTDSDGDDEYNLSLSAERAEAVKRALVKLGVPEERLETEGKGETVPVDSNTTPEGKANNRRVEFVKL